MAHPTVDLRIPTTPRGSILRSHYGFESFFCEPGIDGAHEKGGVERDIGWFRRNHLTPVPAFDTLADLNAFLERCDTADGQRWVT